MIAEAPWFTGSSHMENGVHEQNPPSLCFAIACYGRNSTKRTPKSEGDERSQFFSIETRAGCWIKNRNHEIYLSWISPIGHRKTHPRCLVRMQRRRTKGQHRSSRVGVGKNHTLFQAKTPICRPCFRLFQIGEQNDTLVSGTSPYSPLFGSKPHPGSSVQVIQAKLVAHTI